MLHVVFGRLRRMPARVLCFATMLVPGRAAAHVKWFCGPVDLGLPPRSLAAVLQPFFLLCLAGFLALVLSGAALDAGLSRLVLPLAVRRLWRRALEPAGAAQRRRVEATLIRLGVAGYCLALWDQMAVVPWGQGQRAIITPELLIRHPSELSAIALLQAATGLTTLSRRTCPLAGAGLAVLLATGVAEAGIFHMVDYTYFVGIAWYLLSLRATRPALVASRMPVLCSSLSFALMWTAVEKFLYPQWTAIVLLIHPQIAAGLPIPLVTVVAGFVEFSLAFYLVAGASLLRLDAALLMLVFVAAIPSFGRLDAAGHLPLVAALAVIILHGATPLQAQLRGGVCLLEPPRVGLAYLATLATMVGLYYGLQHVAG